MTKDKEQRTEPGPDQPEGVGQVDRLPVQIHSQYIKDLSFENPNAPMPLKKADGPPNINVDFSMDARKLEDMEGYKDAYEVMLFIGVQASKGDMPTFVCELQYGMMVTLEDVPEDKVHPLLLIEMPNYLFPYARQIISDLTQACGFMPFLLAPVNFKALYRQRFGGPQVNTDAVDQKREKEKESA